MSPEEAAEFVSQARKDGPADLAAAFARVLEAIAQGAETPRELAQAALDAE
ncbi:MAG: hypothetical protein IPM35_17065 [Myxococcales bacterium]|nr:hypothetical protein [Myxococcales bacterium]